MPSPLTNAIIRGSIGLGLFAIITAGLIAVTQATTAERIEKAQKRAQAKALLDIIGDLSFDNDLLENPVTLSVDPLLGFTTTQEAYIAKQGESPVLVLLPFLTPDGYTGDISGLVGVLPDGTIQGVRITAHKETPGLGDKIELRKSDWVLGFNRASLKAPEESQWKVKKDDGAFDQLTGATITPRAVVNAVRNALLYYQSNRRVFLPDLDETKEG